MSALAPDHSSRFPIAVGCLSVFASAIGVVFLLVLAIAMGFAGFSNGLRSDDLTLAFLCWWIVEVIVLALSTWLTDMTWTPMRIATAATLVVASQSALFFACLYLDLNSPGVLLLALFLGAGIGAVLLCVPRPGRRAEDGGAARPPGTSGPGGDVPNERPS